MAGASANAAVSVGGLWGGGALPNAAVSVGGCGRGLCQCSSVGRRLWVVSSLLMQQCRSAVVG